jgi:hypothetical protein
MFGVLSIESPALAGQIHASYERAEADALSAIMFGVNGFRCRADMHERITWIAVKPPLLLYRLLPGVSPCGVYPADRCSG